MKLLEFRDTPAPHLTSIFVKSSEYDDVQMKRFGESGAALIL